MSSYVGEYNIDGLPQGTDFDILIDYQVGEPVATIDLSGYTGKLQVRRGYDKPKLIELTSTAGEIVFASTAPNISVKFPAAKTDNMNTYEDMIYDLEITSPGGLITRVIQGCFSISRQVTK